MALQLPLSPQVEDSVGIGMSHSGSPASSTPLSHSPPFGVGAGHGFNGSPTPADNADMITASLLSLSAEQLMKKKRPPAVNGTTSSSSNSGPAPAPTSNFSCSSSVSSSSSVPNSPPVPARVPVPASGPAPAPVPAPAPAPVPVPVPVPAAVPTTAPVSALGLTGTAAASSSSSLSSSSSSSSSSSVSASGAESEQNEPSSAYPESTVSILTTASMSSSSSKKEQKGGVSVPGVPAVAPGSVPTSFHAVTVGAQAAAAATQQVARKKVLYKGGKRRTSSTGGTLSLMEGGAMIKTADDMAKLLAAGTDPHMLAKRMNSTNSMFVGDTMAVPDDDLTIKSISKLLADTIKEGMDIHEKKPLACFELDPSTIAGWTEQKLAEVPSMEQIYSYISTLFVTGQMSSECNIIALAYMERLMERTGVVLTPSNWRHIVFGAFVLSSKVWDDESMINQDFSYVMPIYSLDDVNRLEIHFLNYLSFDLSISGSTYAKFYFKLRDICDKHLKKKFPLKPLNDQAAKKLEISADLRIAM